jgi:hypothetical protein
MLWWLVSTVVLIVYSFVVSRTGLPS